MSLKSFSLLLVFCTFAYGSSDIVKDYNNWQNQVLDLRLNEDLRKLEYMKLQGELQKEHLNYLYREAEYRILTDRMALENDLLRAKIYYYYHKDHRVYYYYDYNYNVIYLKPPIMPRSF
ncbi:MAG: hypothetical protein ACRC0W_04885 [Cetobacterium sp.]